MYQWIEKIIGVQTVQEELENWSACNRNWSKLYSYQKDGAKWLSGRKRALLADEPGVGKTATSLMALPDNAAAMVIAPSIVKHNWERECKMWRPDLYPVVLSGIGSFRFPAPRELLIINYDILPKWLRPGIGKFWPTWNMKHLSSELQQQAKGTSLIIDEVHKVSRLQKSQRGKSIFGLCKIVKRVWALTGTPLLNRPEDLQGVLTALGMFEEVFGTYFNFLKLFHACPKSHNSFTWGIPHPSIPGLLRKVMLRRLRSEVLPQLPKKTITTLLVNNVDPSLKTDLDKSLEMWQDRSKLPPFENFAQVSAQLAKARIPAMLEIVQDSEEAGIPLVVSSAHRAPIDLLGKRPGWAAITGSTATKKRQEIVDKFQRGELLGIAGTVQAMGVGCTLTHAWKLLEVDLDWVPANNIQVEDRICRIGQTKPVQIVRLVSNHLLDVHRMNLIANKMALADQTLEPNEMMIESMRH